MIVRMDWIGPYLGKNMIFSGFLVVVNHMLFELFLKEVN